MIEPNEGMIFNCDLSPTLGTEQAGRRPVVIISNNKQKIFSKRVFICPITTNIKPHPVKYILDAGYKTKGAVLTDQLRAIDWRERGIRYIETISLEHLLDIRLLISTLIFDFPENQMRDFILQQIKETT